MLIADVSNVNGSVDWHQVASHHIGGAFLKATEGHTFVDSRFAAHRAAARQAGLHVGAYHFARPDLNDPVSEARNFVHVVGKLLPGELNPVLDYEHPAPHLSPAQHLAWIRAFNGVVKSKLGVWPLFYSYPAFVQGLHLPKPVGRGLWLASYSRNDGVEHPFSIPTPWRKVVAHQFSSRGHVPGVSGLVDLSHVDSLNKVLAHPVRGRVWTAEQWLRYWLPESGLV